MYWIRTYSGLRFNYDDIHGSEIRIEDIAHALSNMCRFGGHSKEFYSVAQHSVHVMHHVPDWAKYPALLHDSGEAYTGDIVTPLKGWVAENIYEGMALSSTGVTQLEKRICTHVLTSLHPDLMCFEDWEKPVKEADERMLLTEARDLLRGGANGFGSELKPYPMQVIPWPPKVAKVRFLDAYFQVTKGGKADA